MKYGAVKLAEDEKLEEVKNHFRSLEEENERMKVQIQNVTLRLELMKNVNEMESLKTYLENLNKEGNKEENLDQDQQKQDNEQ